MDPAPVQPVSSSPAAATPAANVITFTLPWAPGSLPLARIAIVALAAFLRLYLLELRPPHFDEGVNGWFLDQMQKTGFYKYDPTNYHGPLHFYVLFAFRQLCGRHLWALRLPVVLMGILTVDWIFRFERFFDRRTCTWAALAMTISPGFLYYQRDAIHETWLVYFLVLLFWGIFGLWQDGRRRYLWAVGLALAGMVLTKETYAIHLGCLCAAVPCLLLLERIWPSRVTFLDQQAVSLHPIRRFREPRPLFLPLVAQQWSVLDLLLVIVTAVGAIVLFYTGTFHNFEGLGGLWTAFSHWGHKARVGEGHNKPFYYWLRLLWHNEPWVAFGLLGCVRWVFPGTSDWRLRLLAVYAPGTLLAYSLIPYKTPWCVLSFAWPFLFIGGALLAEVAALPSSKRFRLIAVSTGLALTAASSFFAIRLNYFRPTVESGEEYVYVQTFPDANLIVDPLLKLAAEDPARHQLIGTIVCDSTYPLPWMLGDFPNIGYYSNKLNPPDYHADFLLITQDRVAKAEAGMNEPYFRQTVKLRSSLDPLNLYFRAALFAPLFPGRTPEFQPKSPADPLPGHQVLPPPS